ncbi:MAG: prolyl oligopeptidase family serine peptidase [Alphaproteobacteria bacterium]|nr:prolyl oligopeptidase family serine peptidase [Alphaproteobacteria bacterium]
MSLGSERKLGELTGPRLPAASGKADRLVVFLHGYGADGQDLISLGAHWARAMPTAAFAAPNAPERCEMSPTGYQWWGFSTRRSPEEAARGAQAVAPLLDRFLDAELARLAIPADRLALVGFSQGTMMALHVGLRRAVAPVGIVGYSGLLLMPERLSEISARPPVLLVHGDADEMIPAARTHDAAAALGEAGVPVQWHISRGIGHGIAPDGLELGGRFLVDAFGGRLPAGARP